MGTHDTVTEVEAHLRRLKNEEYHATGHITGINIHQEGAEDSSIPAGTPMEDIVFRMGVETEDGRRMIIALNVPDSAWDLTNDLVVLLEYLELEPEQLHMLGRTYNDEKEPVSVPVTYDTENNEYTVDFDEMRGELLGDDE